MKNTLTNFALSMVGLVVVGGVWTFLSLNVALKLKEGHLCHGEYS